MRCGMTAFCTQPRRWPNSEGSREFVFGDLSRMTKATGTAQLGRRPAVHFARTMAARSFGSASCRR